MVLIMGIIEGNILGIKSIREAELTLFSIKHSASRQKETVRSTSMAR